jgi:CRP-like cAMP-binding protein
MSGSEGSAVSADPADLRRRFGAVPLLKALPAEAVDELCCTARPRRTPAGGAIVGQGASAERLILLLTDHATSRADTAQGRSVVLETWTAPAALDKVVVFSGQPHPATVAATEDAWWCTVSREVLDGVLDRLPHARRHVVTLVAESARRARSSFLDVSSRSSLARIAAWLLESSNGDRAALPHPQDRLAHQLGMTRVTLNRGLHRLARTQTIALHRHTVVIRDREGLRGLAAG